MDDKQVEGRIEGEEVMQVLLWMGWAEEAS